MGKQSIKTDDFTAYVGLFEKGYKLVMDVTERKNGMRAEIYAEKVVHKQSKKP